MHAAARLLVVNDSSMDSNSDLATGHCGHCCCKETDCGGVAAAGTDMRFQSSVVAVAVVVVVADDDSHS